jgi:hypothetical protein
VEAVPWTRYDYDTAAHHYLEKLYCQQNDEDIHKDHSNSIHSNIVDNAAGYQDDELQRETPLLLQSESTMADSAVH